MTTQEAIVAIVAIIVVGFVIFSAIAVYYMKLMNKQKMEDRITDEDRAVKQREEQILYLAGEKKAEREADKIKKKTIWTFEARDDNKIKDEDVMEIYPTLPPKQKKSKKVNVTVNSSDTTTTK